MSLNRKTQIRRGNKRNYKVAKLYAYAAFWKGFMVNKRLNNALSKFDIVKADHFDLKSSEVINSDDWLTTEEAAHHLKVSKSSLLNMCSNRQVPFYKFGRRNRFLKSELNELILAKRKH